MGIHEKLLLRLTDDEFFFAQLCQTTVIIVSELKSESSESVSFIENFQNYSKTKDYCSHTQRQTDALQ